MKSFLPDELVQAQRGVNLAPMIDFLFLMVVFFASLAISRVTTQDTRIDLVQLQASSPKEQAPQDEQKFITLSVDAQGKYLWVTEMHDYPMESTEAVKKELQLQHEKGYLPEDKAFTKVLLKVDRQATWQPIMELIFAVRDAGFQVRPVYEPGDSEPIAEKKKKQGLPQV